MTAIPLMFIGDAPDSTSGLGRILRDLATITSSLPEFKVATLGYAGTGSVRLPFQQYIMHHTPDPVTSLRLSLMQAFEDFTRGEQGIVMTIWDMSRLHWLAHPEFIEGDDRLRDWLLYVRAIHRLILWGYIPVDSEGPHGRLTAMTHDTLMGFDRLLAYTPFGEAMITQTIGVEAAQQRGLTWLPHACGESFRMEQGRGMAGSRPLEGRAVEAAVEAVVAGEVQEGRHTLAMHGDETLGSTVGSSPTPATKLIGIVGINQERKGWSFAAQLCEQIIAQWPDTRIWMHIDTAIRFVNLHALIADYHLADHVTVTTSPQTDAWMAEQYRKCTMTLLPSSEGFGYSWLESFACDVPCIHTDYAGGASMMRTCGLERYLVPVSAWRVEGQHNCVRPVLDVNPWMYKVGQVLEEKREPGALAASVAHLKWSNLAGRWLGWFKDGLGHE